MDNEQLQKRIEWLDEERRKDKETINQLEKQLLVLEGKLDGSEKKFTQMDSDITRLRTSMARVDDFEESLADSRVRRKKDRNELEGDVKSWIADARKVLQTQIQGLENQLKTNQEELKRINGLEKEMVARVEEQAHVDKQVTDLKKEFKEFTRSNEELERQVKMAAQNRQKELKRLTDLQGEQDALRKRVDTQGGKLDLLESDSKKWVARIENLESIRRDLKKEQESFIEEITLRFTERDNTWKTWENRFDNVEAQSKALEEQVVKLDATHRGVKRMQQEISDLSELLDRRVNEITEMQRLAEERFRNEWSIFTADDQKRWTNYTLAQKEQNKELERQFKSAEDRIQELEDVYSAANDELKQLRALSENQIQTLLNLVREWVTDYENMLDGIQ